MDFRKVLVSVCVCVCFECGVSAIVVCGIRWQQRDAPLRDAVSACKKTLEVDECMEGGKDARHNERRLGE